MKVILFSFIVLSSYGKEIAMKHMPEGDKCIICHHAKNPNQLLLRDGSKIESGQVDILCGQCHGIKHRRWVDGLHGKVVDSWKEENRKRLSCIACHDPHTPKFPTFEAKAPPRLRH